MKKIFIDDKNMALIESILNSIQNRSRERTVTTDEIFKIAKKINGESNILLKKHCKNLRYYYSKNEKMAKSYKYKYEATVVMFEYHSKGWRLIDIRRDIFWSNQGNCSHFFWDISENDFDKRRDEVSKFLLDNFLKTKV